MAGVKKIIPGYNALCIQNNIMYAAKGYTVYKSANEGKSWELDGRVIDGKYSLWANISRLLARLLRIEVSGLIILEDGSRVVTAKKGIFVAKPNSKEYKQTFFITRGTKPLNICTDQTNCLYFGEYVRNGPYVQETREEVHVYKSGDNGQTWEVCYTFPKNTVRHIHGIFYDKFTDKMWFTSGDKGDECIIGNTDDGFNTINIVKQGKQKYRAVQLLFFKDFIVYGTDTEHEKNYIYRFDREGNKEYRLQEIQGSVLSASQIDEYACISTTVEPSEINDEPYAHLWRSYNGLVWEDIYEIKKDLLSLKYFQYGKILFPHNAMTKTQVVFTGHALEKFDNKTVIFDISP